MTDVIAVFHFGLFFALFTALTAQKIKMKKKMKKNTWRPHHFTHMYQKLSSDDVQFLRHDVRQMDGQTGWTDGWTDRWMDRWKKYHREVGAPTENIIS